MKHVAVVMLIFITVIGCSGDRGAERPTTDHRSEVKHQFSKRELAVYAVAVRHMFTNPPTDTDGILFISIDDKDPPPQFLGDILRPGSRAHMAEAEPEEPGLPRKRIRDKFTGERGSHLSVKILEWIGNSRVKVRCVSSTAGLWGGAYDIYVRLKDGVWEFDGEVEDSYEVS